MLNRVFCQVVCKSADIDRIHSCLQERLDGGVVGALGVGPGDDGSGAAAGIGEEKIACKEDSIQVGLDLLDKLANTFNVTGIGDQFSKNVLG
ncbi:MAG: hypothetical protein HFF66_06895 [Oscillospiraceae bacterium]|nr:hypothetical protein [Oscillospiraceae bacterium]